VSYNSDIVPTGPYTKRENGAEEVGLGGESAAALQKREQIQRIAAQLFAGNGYRATGVAEIGDAVGLGRGALYYHIGSKEDLLFRISAKYMEELVESGRRILEEPDPYDRIRMLSRYLMRTISSNLAEMTVCFREVDALTGERRTIVSRLHQDYQDIWRETLRDGAEKGHFRELPLVALKGILGMYFYSFLWLRADGKQSADEIAEIFSDMVFSIVERRKGRRAAI